RNWLASLIMRAERESLHEYERKLDAYAATLPASLTPIQPPARPVWTEADQHQLQGFLKSSIGNKLITMLHGAQYANALKAKDALSCGLASGIGESLKLIGSLANFADAPNAGKPERVLTPEEELFN